jgi:hypothetical protein
MMVAHVDDLIITGDASKVAILIAKMGERFLSKVSSKDEVEHMSPQRSLNFLSKLRSWLTEFGMLRRQITNSLMMLVFCLAWSFYGCMSYESGLQAGDVSVHRPVVGKLLYAVSAVPSCQYTVNESARHMQNPTNHDFKSLKHLARYMVSGRGFATSYRPVFGSTIHAVSDSDWAKHTETSRSTDCATVLRNSSSS